MNLLLIDDDKDFSSFFSEALRTVGACCQVITDPRAVLSFDLAETDHIVIDLSMPNLDGLQVLRFLKDINFAGYISVTSGQAMPLLESAKEICQLHNLNFHTILQKPFDIGFLDELLEPPQFTSVSRAEQKSDNNLSCRLATKFSNALKSGEIDVYFQPKINLETNEITGLEALARWQLAGVFVPPEHFIALAENYNLIGQLTNQIVEKSLSHFARFITFNRQLGLSINLSSVELCQQDLPDFLFEKVTVYGLSPHMITLEITETVLLEKNSVSLEILARFRLMGFQLSIDDFGSGYSSVNMLQNGPFTELKIDKVFIQSMHSTDKSKIIVQSIVDLAKKLELKIVAEGIETRQDLQEVIKAGCKYGQGYFFSKPINATHVTTCLLNWEDNNPNNRAHKKATS
ncbi:EAL domain-containing response regulator [Thalassotalea eurytherma]|uniref:Transcriptional regulator n=1 Tax=Thalassotalea eurytherma TaxID=1144278 RepID=A0ABQ6H941_9GAMM|nr:EAL domain-containing response regulator [Thalassotalea eurytherma]GLX83401.1 transcriptional regulator [Thalassotalea eurytherma]